MSPAAATGSGSVLTRSQIENWQTRHLTETAGWLRSIAAESQGLFEQARRNVDAPGGTEWTGDGKDAALHRVTADIAVVNRQGEVQGEAATIADNGAADIEAAKRDVLAAIAETEADGFRVGEDLSVTDTRRIDLDTLAARQTAAAEHAEDIRWNAERLVAADAFAGQRLEAKATELDGLTFESDGHDTTIQAAGWDPWKQNPPVPPPTPPPPPIQGPERGLPPPGISPPVEGPFTVGPPSRARPRRMGEKSLWDQKGGEWRYYPGDKWHNPHWDYHPGPKAEWDNIPINNLPVRTSEAATKAPKPAPNQAPEPKAPVEASPPKPAPQAPAPRAPVEIPAPRGPMAGGGSVPIGPELVPLPHSEQDLPVLGDNKPGEEDD